ncbi:nuclear transport factor 2 family protein [Oleomonas cavernae]|uniref:Nuclear transport factor 2 family protein n=1 Tax=Oleomonas cavernae TaxID=2320859 RepID=A0A418WTJ9_9PROT|nr:nuclear transport factor 2 family protein [Oleomonas cavernae]RJF94592.1 nuclear transport factor 2 family protein [Oleomonas cavernae]
MEDLKAARERTIRAHMQLENEADWEAVLATFERPRYEFQVPFPGTDGATSVFDGREQVMAYFSGSRAAFPDLGNEVIHVVVGDGDIAMVEFYLVGTHLNPLKTPFGDLPPTGKRIKVRMAATFEFKPGSDKIVSERPYTDPRAILRQLGIAA